MSRLSRIISASAILALAACGGSGGYGTGPKPPPPPPPPPAPNTVTATPSNFFSPGNLTVNVGDVVTFKFTSPAHNVFFDSTDPEQPGDIPGSNVNKDVTRTFNVAGTYTYHCTIHPGMTGTVVVR
jgi:heme/copper-type cytochrome/quinol oxidase subunit 2